MALVRYDKYDPISGGFRAPLAVAWDATKVGVPTAVALDANGRVVAVTAVDTALAVLVIDAPKAAGDVVDCMTHGEIVGVALAAGTTYFSAANSTLDNTAPAAGVNKVKIGHTVEASRLVVRVQKWQG